MNTSVCIIAFCSMVVQAEFGKQVRSRQSVCTDVVKEALSQGVDPVLTAAVSFRESAFKRRAVSQAGAVGPMQVLPRFWCKKKNCDYIEAGVRALKFYTSKYGEQPGLCAYFSGKPCMRSTRSASRYRSSVIMISARFYDHWQKACFTEGC